MKRGEERFEDEREGSYGGFQYRWNYDEYQKSLQRRRKKAADRGLRAFCITASFVFLLSFISVAAVLFTAMSKKEDTVNDGHAQSGSQSKTTEEKQKNTESQSAERTLLPENAASADTEDDFFDESLPEEERVLDALGISVMTVTEDEAELYRVPRGLLVKYVEPDSVGDKNGIRRGDILLTVDGIPATDTEELSEWNGMKEERISAILHLFRDGVPLDLAVSAEQ